MMSNLKFNFDHNKDVKVNIKVSKDSIPDQASTDNDTETQVTVVKADVNALLKQLNTQNSERELDKQILYDVIICDPPKLAPKKTFLKKAMKK